MRGMEDFRRRLDAVDPTQLAADVDETLHWARLHVAPRPSWTQEHRAMVREMLVQSIVVAELEARFAGPALVRSVAERSAAERIADARAFARAAARRFAA